MNRLVIVSNRIPDPDERVLPAGGLAIGLTDVLRDEPSSLWFGWSGNQEDRNREQTVHQNVCGKTVYATLDLSAKHRKGYYQRFCNAIIWPLFHYRLGLMDYHRADWESYVDVNQLFARKLLPLLRPNDTIWIHDYHLFLLGHELRKLNVTAPIGFFLHIPFPPWSLFRALPHGEDILRHLSACDIIGLQTEEDAANMNECFRLFGFPQRAAAFPIGIDPKRFAREAQEATQGDEYARLKTSLQGRPLIIGADRLDYSKGLQERLTGYEKLLTRFPEHRGRVTYLQVTPISRKEVEEYRLLRRQLDEQIGRINGMFAQFDWTPVRYLTQTVPRHILAGFYRLADVGLVTPLRDGMNLVAKEFIAAQDPERPGALVLSTLAGAAPELPDAILINPHDPDDIAEALHLAINMSSSEKKQRWQSLNSAVQASTAGNWSRTFLTELRTAHAKNTEDSAAAGQDYDS
ncbi:MAG: trehalose-6-phosphate synthase [Acetobacter sp.]|jgi:trehalose 6-phosphate synthase